ncbi:MAG TPA: nitrate reductase molybdenum cofactor assembly chaperone [Actinoplanes sp.]|nr:nitrate reductase molybdenum cofactor assembly chaperone [Actinoplanes sp.]
MSRTRGTAGGRARVPDWRPAAWQAQSLLLDYPDERLLAHRPLLRGVAGALPPAVGGPLHRFLDHLDATPAGELAADYVATFDQRRRCSPYLTYFSHGDTRRRGVALLRFTQAYRAAGVHLDGSALPDRPGGGELPDHLAVVLEFAATADAEAGLTLLLEHRAGLELLRLALRELRSPWAAVLDSVSATLPPLRGTDHGAVARLAAEGPPEEQVGLAPYGRVPT